MIVSIKKYAELCGLNVKSVYARIATGKLKRVTQIDPAEKEITTPYIDTEKFPPKRGKIGQGRKKVKIF